MGELKGEIDFNFIYSKDALKIKNFLGTIPRNIECINYMDIFNKLSKNDYYQSEPSDAVVSSYLMRQLQLSISRPGVTSIFYVLSDVSESTIKDIINYVNGLTDKQLIYNIYYTSDVLSNINDDLFNKCIEFEVDDYNE